MRKKKDKSGFSLLEVIIALFVLSIGITAMLSLISNSINNSNEAKDMIAAAQLAQEGVELVRNKRDNNYISDSGNVFQDLNEGVCQADAVSGIVCPQTSFDLNYAVVSGVYSFVHSAGTATKFSRKIVIEETSVEERKARSLVFWGGGWSEPPADDGSDCLNIKKCAYSEATVTSWGEE